MVEWNQKQEKLRQRMLSPLFFKCFKSISKLGASKCFAGYPATPTQNLVCPPFLISSSQ